MFPVGLNPQASGGTQEPQEPGGQEETRQLPQIQVPPQQDPAPQQPPPPGQPPHQGQPQAPDAPGSPFTIRPGAPSGAYGDQQQSPFPSEEPPGAEATRVLPPVVVDDPPPHPSTPAHGAQPAGPPGPAAWSPPPSHQPPTHQPPTHQPQSYAQPAPHQPGGHHHPGHQAAARQPGGPEPAAATGWSPPEPSPRMATMGDPGPERRGLSRPAVVGIVVACCAVAGLIGGAVLSGGDDKKEDPVTPGSSESATSASKAPTSQAPQVDPAEQQAKDLDALLAESNNSRSAVITAVNEISSCKNLDGAAKSLRDAANQRNDLVTRLGELSVDKLPDHAKLTSALNEAWKSSASADNHYAAWADQVAGKGGCKKGRAKVTNERQAGDRESGKATDAKKRAAELWNAIAREYDLTERQNNEL
ncbi:hypothetical protein AQ490_17645 [Wenjunlia vitaminophila]|uniref:Uncharacterized protein n=2 Tax=Wenjunlia vitaminophila TaxID=76728 RepID=A0A0T6LV96_WENVI|nr:hypothetical protein AQ490_17645 [Wenjunlia vitaminophila]